MDKLSDLCHNIQYEYIPLSDSYHILTDELDFFVTRSSFDHLKYGLEAHYSQNEYLLSCSDDELKELSKQRPRRSSVNEINYQLIRKGFNGQLIKANQLVSRLPVFSQSRNRNGKQNIADKRWRDAVKNKNLNVMWLTNYYKYEEDLIRATFPNVQWTKGTFAISPCHIYPALKDRNEASWTPDKIVRDLSLVNKAFDKISASPLKGKHAISKEDAEIALDWLDTFDYWDLSVTRQVLYVILSNRISNGFYNVDRISDIGLGI